MIKRGGVEEEKETDLVIRRAAATVVLALVVGTVSLGLLGLGVGPLGLGFGLLGGGVGLLGIDDSLLGLWDVHSRLDLALGALAVERRNKKMKGIRGDGHARARALIRRLLGCLDEFKKLAQRRGLFEFVLGGRSALGERCLAGDSADLEEDRLMN